MENIIEFARGDAANHVFRIPAASWSAGGKLFFTAKPEIDDDDTDAAAVIEHEWTDSVVTDITVEGVPYKRYACYFPPSATEDIESSGAESLDYLGEFQFIPSSGDPITYPARQKLDCKVWFDVTRRTA